MDPNRPRSELRTYPHPPPPPHHMLPSSNYVLIHQNGDAGGGVPVPIMEHPYHFQNMSGTIPGYSIPSHRGSHEEFLQPQLLQQPPNVQPPPRSTLIDPQPRLHYQQYDNNPPPPLQIEHLNDEQAELSTQDFIYQGNTESMINDSVNEAFLTTAASSMSINDANVHAPLPYQHAVNYSPSSDRNIYSMYNTNHCVTSIPRPSEGVLDLSKADDLTLTQFKEEQELSPSPLPVPYEMSQGQQASVIVHTANISPGSRSSVPEANSEEYGAFRILTTPSASPAKDRCFRAFPTNRPRAPYLHANHFGNPNLQQQQIELQHQYTNIMSDIPADQKPLLATNHLTEPVLNYNTSPITSSPHQWNGAYTTQNQLVSPSKSHPRLHSSNASQSLSAIVDMNNQLSQRHFSENSVVGEQLMHHLTQSNVPPESHYNPATTTIPTNFSPGTQLQMMHEDANYVHHPSTSTPGPSPKKTKSPRNSCDKMGRGRGIKKLGNHTPGSPDVTAPFQNAQNHYNHQSTSGYQDMIDQVEGMTLKKGRGRGKKVIATALNISCAESDFGAVSADVNHVDLNKSLNVFTAEELQRHVENGEVVIKKKRPYKKRAQKSLNNSVDSGGSPEKPIKKILGPKVNRKNKSDQLEPIQSQPEHLPNFESISRGVLNLEDNLPAQSQVISVGTVGSTARGKVRGHGVRRSTGEGRGRGARRSIGEGRGVRRSIGEGRGAHRSVGEGRGRGSRCQPAPRINDEMVMESDISNEVGMVIPSQQQVPWVGPPPGSNEFSINGVVPNNHMRLLQPYQQKSRVIVDGKPLDISGKSIAKILSVPNPSSVIPSNQFVAASVQAQMAETGELPVSSSGIVRQKAAKGQRKSLKPKSKVRMELYQGSDDEIDSNAEDDDDEDYEDLERRQRITRRKSGRAQQQRRFVDENVDVDIVDDSVVEKQNTFYSASLSPEVNGLPNEMPVSVPDIKKEKGGDDDPMQQPQQEAEKAGESANSLQQEQSNVPLEDTLGVGNVKQENVEEEAVSGTSEMQVDTEGTFGDAESGLVAATIADVKPDVGKLKVKNRRLLPSSQRQLKRPIKKPRIPMRESLAVNFTPRGVEKRGRKKKPVSHENIVVKTEEFESKPKDLVEKTEVKLVIPKYTNEEKELLYADKRFVIDISSVDKAPDQIYIWQIIESENCLRQYYPSKYGERQFFISSPVKWYFFEEEFKSDEFYARFLPIVVIIANVINQTIERGRKVSPSDEFTVQYVYVDKPFFVRMLKCIGKIDTIEFLRQHFINSLSVLTLIAIEPLFLNGDVRYQPCVQKFKDHLNSWVYFGTYIYNLLRKVFPKFPFQQEILQNLLDYPSLIFSAKDVNKSEACSACHRSGSVPCVAVKFPTRGHMEKPYHRDTLIEFAPGNFPQPPKPMNFCRGCSNAAKKLHRMIHFRYNVLKLIKQNVAKDVATFHKYKTRISDEILLWIQAKDVSWKNVIFLDFQVIVGEVEAEYTARSNAAIDAPNSTPIANPELDPVVPNEI